MVDHVTLYRWVQRFTPELVAAVRPSRHVAGDRWFVDETYPESCWAVGVPVPGDRPARAGRPGLAEARFGGESPVFARALNAARRPTEVTTDPARAYPRVLDELVPEVWHVVKHAAESDVEQPDALCRTEPASEQRDRRHAVEVHRLTRA